VEQAAELLKVNYETARRWVKTGGIPDRKIGKVWRVVESDLSRFMAEGHTSQLAYIQSRGETNRFA